MNAVICILLYMLLTAEPLTNGHFDRGYPLSEVKLYCYGPVGITEPVLYIERSNALCPLVGGSFKRCSTAYIAIISNYTYTPIDTLQL